MLFHNMLPKAQQLKPIKERIRENSQDCISEIKQPNQPEGSPSLADTLNDSFGLIKPPNIAAIVSADSTNYMASNLTTNRAEEAAPNMLAKYATGLERKVFKVRKNAIIKQRESLVGISSTDNIKLKRVRLLQIAKNPYQVKMNAVTSKQYSFQNSDLNKVPDHQ